MAEGFSFFLNSILFGVGLAMDAFSVSVANALADPGMRHARRIRIAGCFALFQIAMPLVGWLCVRTLAERFHAFERLTPWIALILLLYIGGKMIVEALRGGEKETAELGHGTLLLQGVATSIDALSVGFTIERYPFSAALAEALIIGAVTGGGEAVRRRAARRGRHPHRHRHRDLPHRRLLIIPTEQGCRETRQPRLFLLP